MNILQWEKRGKLWSKLWVGEITWWERKKRERRAWEVKTRGEKWTSLVCFIESEDVNFALLQVMGPVAASYVDCAMTILSSPLLTCTTWVLLGAIDEVEINQKIWEVEMSYRVCHKFLRTNFVNFLVLQKLAKQIGK